MGLLTNLIEKRVEQHHQDELDKQNQLRDTYKGIWQDRGISDPVGQHFFDEYIKTLTPGARKTAQSGYGFLDRLKSAFRNGPQQQQAVQPQQPQAPIPAPTTQPAAQQQPPLDDTQEDVNPNPRQQAVQALRAGPAPVSAETLQKTPGGNIYPFQNYGVAAQQRNEDRLTKIGKDAGLNDRELGLYVASGGKVLPPTKMATARGPRPGVDPETGKPYEGVWIKTTGPDGEAWTKAPSTGRITEQSSDWMSPVGLKQWIDSGHKAVDEDGKDIKPEDLPDGHVWQSVFKKDGTQYYKPKAMPAGWKNVGGEIYAVPKGTETDPSKWTKVGQAQVATTSTRDVPSVDPTTGQVTVNTMSSSRTPKPTGAIGAQPSSPTPAPQSGKPSAPIPAPSSVPSGSSQQTSAAASPTAAPAPGVIGGSTIRGMPSNMFNAAKQQALTVREAATQIHGDPENPEMKGLTSYKDLADDPKSSAKIGKALGIILQGMNDAPDTAHISGHLGPVSASTGGIGALITNALGVPQKLAQQKADIIRNTVGTLTDREAEALNATVSALSTIISLRSLTKAPATQLSMAAIERELPMIGINVKDSKQFDDKIKRVSEVMLNGARGVPENIIGSKLMERVRGKQEPVKAPPAKKGAADKPKTLGAMSHKELFDALAASK